ncbi:hypothetical protein [Rhodococcus sp. H29-C3]|uniref:hypothetical protein n=1 Tax=Rhodococcus sp. H29-C3 TaxID=3046307 RepID=UPI0024B8BEFF|nr:hypothetical protein [Rhodococcus sp. H29-C3]MDJ0363489.1 hypothetical protein [Rhodococcus sp. H29-C3]
MRNVDNQRLRLLVGDDAPGQVAAALKLRLDDYGRDSRFGDHNNQPLLLRRLDAARHE